MKDVVVLDELTRMSLDSKTGICDIFAKDVDGNKVFIRYKDGNFISAFRRTMEKNE